MTVAYLQPLRDDRVTLSAVQGCELDSAGVCDCPKEHALQHDRGALGDERKCSRGTVVFQGRSHGVIASEQGHQLHARL